MLEEATLPEMPASELAGIIITDEALSAFEQFYQDGSVRQLRDVYAPCQPEINAAVTGADLVKAWRIRRALQQRMADFFATYDVIVTPNFMSMAPRIDDDLYDSLPCADPVGAVGNACGLPAIALPCGFGKDHIARGLPDRGATVQRGPAPGPRGTLPATNALALEAGAPVTHGPRGTLPVRAPAAP